MSKVYEMVTNRIIEMLEAGTVPWRKPWNQNLPVNWVTQKPYRGINTMLLGPGEYATFNQIKAAGGKVKKGEKSHMIVFWKWLEVEDVDTNEKEKIPFLRYYNVFEVGSQVEGMKLKRGESETFDHNPIDEAEAIVKGYKKGPEVYHVDDYAYYNPVTDYVNVPRKEHFPVLEEYYCTLFHELAHSTGHKKRLNREGVQVEHGITFGSERYSKEELVAELCASMLCGVAGIDNTTLDNSASYIQGWLKRLKEDNKFIVSAAAQAQKASDLILDVKFETE